MIRIQEKYRKFSELGIEFGAAEDYTRLGRAWGPIKAGVLDVLITHEGQGKAADAGEGYAKTGNKYDMSRIAKTAKCSLRLVEELRGAGQLNYRSGRGIKGDRDFYQSRDESKIRDILRVLGYTEDEFMKLVAEAVA